MLPGDRFASNNRHRTLRSTGLVYPIGMAHLGYRLRHAHRFLLAKRPRVGPPRRARSACRNGRTRHRPVVARCRPRFRAASHRAVRRPEPAAHHPRQLAQCPFPAEGWFGEIVWSRHDAIDDSLLLEKRALASPAEKATPPHSSAQRGHRRNLTHHPFLRSL
jgi:hypothetical protein